MGDEEKSFFFDDGLAWTTGANLHTALEKMQNVLDTISAWGPKLGIKFSTTKTKYMIFTRKNVNLTKSDGSEMNLDFYGKPIERGFSYKYLVERCQKLPSVLQSVAHKNLGADRKSLAVLY